MLVGQRSEGAPGCDSDALQQPRGYSCRCPSLELDRRFRGRQSLAALQSETLMTDRLRVQPHRMMGGPIASLKSILHELGIGCGEAVLGGESLTCQSRREIT